MNKEKFNATKYKNDFAKEKYDKFLICVPKGRKTIIQEFAKTQGKSLNAYVVELINKSMEYQQN